MSVYSAGSLIPDSSNGAVFDRSLTVNGLKIVVAGAVGGQSTVPDSWALKIARVVQLIIDPNAPNINIPDQIKLINTLRGAAGTFHAGYPTAQRIGYGGGSTYTPNWLEDAGIPSYSGYQEFLNTHLSNDMIWYRNINGPNPTTSDSEIEEVMEHIFHTIHLFGIPGAVTGSSTAVNWRATDFANNDWKLTELHLAMAEAINSGKFDPSGYAANWNTVADAAEVAYKEYMYLLNWGMWEMSEFWDGESLSPEWSDDMRTVSGIQTNNPLGYALFNSYFNKVLSKPNFSTLKNIFQGNDIGISGYVQDYIQDSIEDAFSQTAFIDGSYYNNIDSQWFKTGIQTPGFNSYAIIGGKLVINYDSDFDILRNGLTPFLNFNNVDSNGNSIIWSSSIKYDDGANVPNSRFATISIVGSTPQFSVVPSKDPYEQYKTNIIRFETSSLPAFSLYDSDKQIEYNNLSKLSVDLNFSYSSANITSNHGKGYSLVTIGSPLVNFFNNSNIIPFGDNQGLHFNNNGTKLFVNNNSKINQYDLTVPYDTLTMENLKSYTPHLNDGDGLTDLTFNDSGNKMYLVNNSGNKIHEYDIDTPFDITTAIKRDNILNQSNLDKDIVIVDNGSKLITKTGTTVVSHDLEENYNISTWNNTTTSSKSLTTLTYQVTENRYPSSYERKYSGVYYFRETYYSGGFFRTRWVSQWDHSSTAKSYCFSSDGQYIFWVTGLASYFGRVYRQTLTTPWDITSATSTQTRNHTIGKATSDTFERNDKNNGVQCIRVSPDGLKLFLLDTYTHSIFQHNMTTAYSLSSIGSNIRELDKVIEPNGGYEVKFTYSQIPNPTPTSSYTDTSNVRNFSFNSSGTKLYITNDNDVYEYNLISPFDLNSVTYVTSYSIFSSDISTDGGIFIGDSDQRIYAYGSNSIRQYNLDSNLSTISDPFKSKELVVTSEDNQPTGIYFNNSGTTLYMSGAQTNSVFKYTLTDKDKIYSASFDSAYSAPALITNLSGIVTNKNEDKMYLLSDRLVAEININSQFSTSTDPGVSYTTVKGNSANRGIRWNNDGSQFIIAGNSTLETYKTDNPYRVIPI